LKRSDIFLTSKLGKFFIYRIYLFSKKIKYIHILAPSDHGKDRVRQAVLESLSKLGTPYLDLYLVHWPGAGRLPSQSPANKSLRIETWLELEQLQKEGKLRSIGVSNYLESHLKELFEACSTKPAVNQVKSHDCSRYISYFQFNFLG
jgi:diketogulonate reductase-like aldo/keto reductase